MHRNLNATSAGGSGSVVRVVGFGTYDLGKHPRVGVILDGLRQRGTDVAELNRPLGLTTAERVAMLGKPWLAYRLLLRILARWASLARGSVRARRGGRPDAVIVGYLGHFDVLLARALFPRTRIVLDMMVFAADTARDRGVTGGLKLHLLEALDRLAVRCADVVVLDTDEHRTLLSPGAQGKAVVVPVGAPDTWFAAAASTADGSPAKDDAALCVVFFGLFTPLQGAGIIGQALGMLSDRPDIAVTMIGAGQDYAVTHASAAANKSVTWIDWVESADLPGIVARHDVCLGIFGWGPKAGRVVPNKVYQGAATGCAIVTSDTAPQRRMLGDAAVYVPAGDASALAQALRALADDPGRLKALREAARSLAMSRFTASAIVEPLCDRLAT
ncbi:MAG: hypothetical protein QOH14_1918 [Pseudonocardiales bacterium]|jgi:glycosyltransferase involved in cell wall biosynthesis|nr:hypothetical protein [Pseudonocardiales bacterium]